LWSRNQSLFGDSSVHLFHAEKTARIPELQIIGQVSDGLEAVRKAEELQPDLILLDIGLPTLNGVDSARRIRKLAPQSKMLFLSQESSAEQRQMIAVFADRDLGQQSWSG
jgi:DNA-binding NarL/FixJ family response regulator